MNKLFLLCSVFLSFFSNAQNGVITAKNSVIYTENINYPFPKKVLVSSNQYEIWDMNFVAVDSVWEAYTTENKDFFASLGEDTSQMIGTWNVSYESIFEYKQTVKINELFSFDFKKNMFTYQNDADHRVIRQKITNVGNDENHPEDPNCFIVWLEDEQGNFDAFALNLATNTVERCGNEGNYIYQRYIGAEVKQTR
jgi:hypothetical protein